MASSSSAGRMPCVTCGNRIGIFKCEGCSQVFCPKHANKHRDNLNYQFGEIINEHNDLHHKISQRKSEQLQRHPSMIQIDKWEKDSIVKLRQVAEKARQELVQSIKSHADSVSEQLLNLAKQLQKAREVPNFVETDLLTWKAELEKLRRKLTDVQFSINIPSESFITSFIGKIPVSTETLIYERFEQFSGDIHIRDNGRKAHHGPSGRHNASVRGAGEYFSGQHRIHFKLNKTSVEYSAAFGIVSKLISMTSQTRYRPSPFYGWNTRDNIIDAGKWITQSNSSHLDMSGKSSFEIELLLDCDNRMISYLNVQTRKIRELPVNIDKCPFPWQFECYLFDIDDCVRLLSSQHFE